MDVSFRIPKKIDSLLSESAFCLQSARVMQGGDHGMRAHDRSFDCKCPGLASGIARVLRTNVLVEPWDPALNIVRLDAWVLPGKVVPWPLCSPKMSDLHTLLGTTCIHRRIPPTPDVYALWDRLAEFSAGDGDTALIHLLTTLCAMIAAQNAPWPLLCDCLLLRPRCSAGVHAWFGSCMRCRRWPLPCRSSSRRSDRMSVWGQKRRRHWPIFVRSTLGSGRRKALMGCSAEGQKAT